MSQFNPKKLNIETIHAGQRYPDTRSAFLPSDVNEIIESLYGISLGVENSAKRAFIMSTPGNLIDISAVNKNIYFPKGTTIYADGYEDIFSKDKYVEFDRSVQLLKTGQVLYNKMDKSLSIIPYGFKSGSTYQFLYLFSFAYDSENNLVTDLPVEHLVNGEKQSSDRTITKEPYSVGNGYISINAQSYEIAISEGTVFGDIAFNWDEAYSYAENVDNEEGYLYDIAIVYDRTEELIKSIYLYELYEHRNYAWLFTIRMEGDKFVYCDLEAPFYVDGVLYDGGSSVEIVQETGESTTAVMSQKASTESFVPKVTTTGEFDRAYVVRTDGTQETMRIGSGYPHANTLVARQNQGQVLVGEPTENRHATTKKYVDDGFLPKITTNTGVPRVYTVNEEGTIQGSRAMSWGAASDSVAVRGTNGTLIIGAPTENNHAVNLEYANKHYAPKLIFYSDGTLLFKTDGTVEQKGISVYAQSWTIAARDGEGNFLIGTPTKPKHATTKEYVDAVYRHDITLEGGFDYVGTIGYMACTVYSRSNKPWDYSGFDCNLTGRATATGIINIEGTEYNIVGLEKGGSDIPYYICYTKPGKTEIMGEEKNTYVVEKFNFYDGTGYFTDTVTQMI